MNSYGRNRNGYGKVCHFLSRNNVLFRYFKIRSPHGWSHGRSLASHNPSFKFRHPHENFNKLRTTFPKLQSKRLPVRTSSDLWISWSPQVIISRASLQTVSSWWMFVSGYNYPLLTSTYFTFVTLYSFHLEGEWEMS